MKRLLITGTDSFVGSAIQTHLARGGFHAFLFDCRCFLGTVFSGARGDGILEGGTGTLHKNANASKP